MSVMCASSGSRLPLRPLHERQAVMQFIQLSGPPRETGMMCSRVRSSSAKRPPQ